MNEEHFNRLIESANRKRDENLNKIKRRIEMGYINGKVYPNGSIMTTSPKGIQNWYTTSELVKLVSERFDRNESLLGRRICYINGKYQLQIRGKHLRRLLKVMPNVKQIGRMLVEEK
jgi:glutamine cyclotransferase